MNKPALFCLCLLLTFFSCKRPRLTSSTPETTPDLDEFIVQEIDFNYFNAKSRVSYKDADNTFTATVNIRMKKDSLIWLSVSKAGIEGARSLITRDSIYVLNKLKNEYTVYDFQSLSQKFNFTIDFDLMQAAIVGNLPVERKKSKEKLTTEKDFFLLRQSDQAVEVNNYIGKDNQKLKKIVMVEPSTNNSLTLDYEDFRLLNAFLFPYKSLVSLQYKSPEGYYHTLVTIQHQKAEISDKELKFPFNVPDKYERK